MSTATRCVSNGSRPTPEALISIICSSWPPSRAFSLAVFFKKLLLFKVKQQNPQEAFVTLCDVSFWIMITPLSPASESPQGPCLSFAASTKQPQWIYGLYRDH